MSTLVSLFLTFAMKALAPGTVIFHRHRGYGVITSVNLLTGWISARFGSEARTLDLNLSTDEVQFADGVAILFRRAPPDRMPHARLMEVVRQLHRAGYQRLYLYSWPKPSGLHWRWHLFTGQRDWMQRSWREGWYGSGADYNVNPVMGWGDTPGASTEELIHALAKFDPQGLAQALGRDDDHTAWFDSVCEVLLPGYMYSLDMQRPAGAPLQDMPPVPVIPVRASLPPYAGPALAWPPGWAGLWSKLHAMPAPAINLTGIPQLPEAAASGQQAADTGAQEGGRSTDFDPELKDQAD